jgi:hypothetical protein
MYGLSADTKLNFLLNKELEQVAVGKYDVQLHFYGAVEISIRGNATFKGFLYNDSWPAMGKAIIDLLGSFITKVIIPGTGDLELIFSNGENLIIHDSDEHYECYDISGGPEGLISV